MYACRGYLENNDRSRPSNIRRALRSTPIRREAMATLRRSRQDQARGNPAVPPTKFVERESVQYDSAKRLRLFRAINGRTARAANSYNPELAGQLAAIGIVKAALQPRRGCEDPCRAAAVGNAAGRALNWRPATSLDWTCPDSLGQHAVAGRRQLRDATADDHRRASSNPCRRPAPRPSNRGRRFTTRTRSTPQG
jgi:hypothetical protein